MYKEQLTKLRDKLTGNDRPSESNIELLKEASRQLGEILLELREADPTNWDGILIGYYHTKDRHIEYLRNKKKSIALDAYKYGYDQTLYDLNDVLKRL